jgi:prepilin-type N-terminal cleavage/methylation domain
MQTFIALLPHHRPASSPAFAQRAPFRPQSGFSLAEVLTVLSVLTVLTGIALPQFEGWLQTRRLEAHAAELAGDIQYLRSEAVSRNSKMHLRFGTDSQGTCYLLHSGSVGDCSCSSAGTAHCTSASSASLKVVGLSAETGVRLEANVTSMLFDPVHGTTTPAGSVNLVASNGKSIRHVINIMGRTRICSPGGNTGGYAVC